jgi:hypothetical protein
MLMLKASGLTHSVNQPQYIAKISIRVINSKRHSHNDNESATWLKIKSTQGWLKERVMSFGERGDGRNLGVGGAGRCRVKCRAPPSLSSPAT